MRETTCRFSRWLALGLVCCLALSNLKADDTTVPPVKDPPDPPGTTLYMGQLRLIFDMWDKDKDGFLDKQELAWAFRGPNAKPYDYDPKADKAKTTPSTTSDKPADPTADKPADKPAADKPADKPADDSTTPSSGTTPSKTTPSTKKPDYSQYPDYVFLMQVDSDSDGMISRSEFMTWARAYATQLKAQADAAQKLAQIQSQLANPKLTAAEMKKLQADLKKAQAAQTKLASQVKSFDTTVTQALATKKKS